MLGYFRKKALTDEKVDIEGWYHSGDIGSINEDGTLYLHDRISFIVKNSWGEWIAPEKLEMAYGSSPSVKQIVILPSGFHDYVAALIVPTNDLKKKFPSNIRYLICFRPLYHR
jgi:long-chain acyl-CoA synthetase